MVTIFATLDFDGKFIPDPSERSEITLRFRSGFGMLIYTWITSFIWPCVLWMLVYKQYMIDEDVFNFGEAMQADDGASTARDPLAYFKMKKYTELSQLLKFGYKVPDNDVDSSVK